MGLRKLAMTMLFVEDFGKVTDFYGEVLKLERTELDDKGKWATFKFPDGGAEIAIHGVPDGAPAPTRAQGLPPVVPSVQVDDMESTLTELKGRGVTIVKEIHEPMPGLKLSDIADPEGNVINLFETAHGTHGS